MRLQKLHLRAVLVFTVLTLLFSCSSRDVPPTRPANVPASATYVPGGKVGGWWQYCAIDDQHQTHCIVWNAVGLKLHDEVFLPYDQGVAVTEGEAEIASHWEFPGDDRVRLKNGRVLLPRSRFEEVKRFLDRLYGRTSTPR